MSKEKYPKRRRGKPLKDPSDKQRVVSLGISPATEAMLRKIGMGSVQDGLRADCEGYSHPYVPAGMTIFAAAPRLVAHAIHFLLVGK
jgi:hypothetical protein